MDEIQLIARLIRKGDGFRSSRVLGKDGPSNTFTYPENAYPRYHRTYVRQVKIIRTLRTTVYSLDVIKEIIQELDQNNLEQARQFAQYSISYLNKINHDQFRGAHYLYQLCRKLTY